MDPNLQDSNVTSPNVIVEDLTQSDKPANNNSSKNNAIVLVLILLILGLLSLLVYLFYQNTLLKQQIELIELDVDTITNHESEQIYNPSDSIEFQKSQLDLNGEFAFGQPFPDEISDLNEENLIGLKCTDLYSRHVDGKFYGYFGESTEPTEMTDADLLQVVSLLNDEELLDELEKEYETVQYEDSPRRDEIEAKFKDAISVNEIKKCDTEDGRVIVYYDSASGGGGSESVSYYSFLESVDSQEKVAIPTDGSPYFNCREVIALTKANVLYVLCGGGDGGYGSSSVYAINMQNNSYELLTRCESRSNLDGTDPQISCSN